MHTRHVHVTLSEGRHSMAFPTLHAQRPHSRVPRCRQNRWIIGEEGRRLRRKMGLEQIKEEAVQGTDRMSSIVKQVLTVLCDVAGLASDSCYKIMLQNYRERSLPDPVLHSSTDARAQFMSSRSRR